MSDYIVSARKYRPMTFDSVVGQSALTTTLKNAIHSGKLAHAYLFCGPRGVGKTTCARIFAKTINCLSPGPGGEACNDCESCRAFNEQRSYNIHELDAASNNSVEDIRQLIEQVRIPPQVGRYKVFIIDEVHMLSQAAFNAFLKTLEEPPAHAIFILATTEKHKILPTILSRCQIYDFNRMEVADIVGHLSHVAQQEGIAFEESALGVIARKADGGMRDALSIFDQVASFTGGNITYQKVIEDLNVLDYDYYFRVTEQLLACNVPLALLTLNEILSKGFEANLFMGGLAAHFRDLLVSRDEQTLPLLEVDNTVRQRYVEQARKCPVRFLYRALKLCNDCDINYRTSRNKRLLVELTLIEVAQLAQADDGEASGLGPTKKLKPLFKATEAQAAPVKPAQSRTAQQPASASPVRTAAPATAATPTVASPSAHAQQPAAQPAATRAATPLRGRLKTFSISRPQNQQVAEGGTAPGRAELLPEEPSQEHRSNPIDEESVNYAWLRYALALPAEMKAISGRMRVLKPRIVEGTHVDTLVDNDRVAEYFAEYREKIERFMRDELCNDGISLTFSVDRSSKPVRAYSRREIYEDLMKRNSHMRRMVQMFELELD